MQDLDALVGTQPLFLLGSWIANATRFGTSNATANATCDGSIFRFDCGGLHFCRFA
jgi:hypothetical protein